MKERTNNMLGPTHRAFGLMSSAGTLVLANKYTPIFAEKEPMTAIIQASAIIGVSIIASVLPDIDRLIPFIRHRGITHAIWIPMLIAYFIYQYQDNPYYVTPLIGLFIGYTGHIIGDAFSTAGVALLYPIERYKDYNSGAFHVKGFRGIFQPLYKVGEAHLVNPVWLYNFVGSLLTILLIIQLFS